MSVQEDYLADIADAIREKEGSTDPIPAAEFAERVRGIETLNSFPYLRPYFRINYVVDGGVMTIDTLISQHYRIRAMIALEASARDGAMVLLAYRREDGVWIAQYVSSSSVSDPEEGIIEDISGPSLSDHWVFKWAVYPDEIDSIIKWNVVFIHEL